MTRLEPLSRTGVQPAIASKGSETMNKLCWAMTIALAPVALVVPALAQPETTAPAVPGTATNTPQQRSPANTTTATPPAVTTSNADSKTAAAPVKGANSFTVDEARRRIEAGGFTQVSDLKKDNDGIWRGQALKVGTSVSVFCDYLGNVGAS